MPQGAHLVPSAGQYLVRVSLMPNIPDQSIIRSIKNIVTGYGELNSAKAGSQMPSCG